MVSWSVVVAAVSFVASAVAAPAGVSVQVGPGGVDVGVGRPSNDGRTSGKTVDVNVGGGGVGVDVGTPHHTRSFSKPVEVDVGSSGVNVDVGGSSHPHDFHDTGFTKLVDVNVGGGGSGVHHPHTHTHSTHHVLKTHTVDPHFKNTETFAALDNAGSDLFQGLGNAATALGDFLSRILGGGRK